MRPLEWFRSKLPQLSILGIIISLIVIGGVMHSWFIRSAESEIQNARRNFYGVIIQTVGREFQRYGMFISEFESIAHGNPLSELQARGFLERTIRTWGPSGSVPGLVHAVVIAKDYLPASPLTQFSLLRENARDWHESNQIGFVLPQNLLARLVDNDVAVMPLPSSNGFGTILLAGRAGKSSHLLLILVIDGQEFYDIWLQPALASVIPDASLSLKIINPQSGNPTARETESDPVTSFNPLASLFGIHPKDFRQLNFSLPRFVDFYRNAINLPGPGNGPNPPRFQINPRADRTRMGDHGGILSLEFKPGSSLDSLEFRLALNWLGGMSLLAGVGIAFFLVVHQTNRLRQSRSREREFVAGITHELRTPLTVIQSCADNLAGGIVSSDRLVSYGELIREQSHRLGRMIEDVLRFSGVEGRPDLPPNLVTLFPVDLIAGMRSGLDALAADRAISLDWKLDSLPRSCRGDPDALRLILENLVVNAIIHAYTEVPNGQVRIEGGTIGTGKLWISVEDDGRGIPHSEFGHVFQPFFRGKSSRNNQETGAGLGLHLARRTARQLGGDIKLESPYRRAEGSRNQGCRFTLILPLITETVEND